jgi:mannitol PTS system EIICBA or EIICB component
MTDYTPAVVGNDWKANVQRLGAKLAGMIMPNIGAFIAWGLITTLFIPVGWLGDWSQAEKFAVLVGPMIFFLLPTLIGYTGGRMVHGQRGAVIGAVATFGAIMGGVVDEAAANADGAGLLDGRVPMFLGAMIIGPLAAWVLKQWDERIQHRVRAGFEMLVDNFSLGIIGTLMAMFGIWVIGPIASGIAELFGDGVDAIVEANLLPLASLIVEPAKVLFLNNAINHGVFTPLGATDAAETGKSILFMIETNPGPGLGILIAYWLFGPRTLRPTVPAAAIVHFLGGIHEIYFPYVLMKPRLILAAIAGGATGVAVFQATDAGLRASPAPGSIFAYFAQCPAGDIWKMVLGVVLSCAVSAIVGGALLGFRRNTDEAEDLDAAREEVARNKAASKGSLSPA